MRARFLLIPAILATTAAIADTPSTFSDRTDAQARAAALLSRPHRSVTASSLSNPSPVESTKGDAHARAAALLSPQRTEGATTSVPVVRAMVVTGCARACGSAAERFADFSGGAAAAGATDESWRTRGRTNVLGPAVVKAAAAITACRVPRRVRVRAIATRHAAGLRFSSVASTVCPLQGSAAGPHVPTASARKTGIRLAFVSASGDGSKEVTITEPRHCTLQSQAVVVQGKWWMELVRAFHGSTQTVWG